MKIKFQEKIPILVSVIALIISMATFIRDCSQNKKLDELQYKNISNEHRPFLRIIGDPIIQPVIKSNYKFAIKDMIKDIRNHIVAIPIPLELYIKLNIINSGNAYAKIYCEIFTDTLSGVDKIREFLLDKEKRNLVGFVSSPEEFYPEKCVFPGDTISSENQFLIQFIDKDTFTIHFFLLYFNEYDILYDTYYWATYEIKNQYLDSDEVFISPRGLELPINMQKIKNSFILLNKNLSSKIWSKEESEDILHFLENNHSGKK